MATEEVAAAIQATGMIDTFDPSVHTSVHTSVYTSVHTGDDNARDFASSSAHASLGSPLTSSPFLMGLKTPPPAHTRSTQLQALSPAHTSLSSPMSLESQEEIIEEWLQLASPHHLRGFIVNKQHASEPAPSNAANVWSPSQYDISSYQLVAPLTSDGLQTYDASNKNNEPSSLRSFRPSSFSSMGPLRRPRSSMADSTSGSGSGTGGSGSGSGTGAMNLSRLLSLSDISPASVEASLAAQGTEEGLSPHLGSPTEIHLTKIAGPRQQRPTLHRESFTVWLDSNNNNSASNPPSPDSPDIVAKKGRVVGFKDLSPLLRSSSLIGEVIEEEPLDGSSEMIQLPFIKTSLDALGPPSATEKRDSSASLERPSSSSSPNRVMEASLSHMGEGFLALSLHQADRIRDRVTKQTSLAASCSSSQDGKPVPHGPWMPLDSEGNVESDPNSPHLCNPVGKKADGGSPSSPVLWNADLFEVDGGRRNGSGSSLNRPPPRIGYWNLTTESPEANGSVSGDADLGSPPSGSQLSSFPRSDLRTPPRGSSSPAAARGSSSPSASPAPAAGGKRLLTMSPLRKNPGSRSEAERQSLREQDDASRSPLYASPSPSPLPSPSAYDPLSPLSPCRDQVIDQSLCGTTEVIPDTPTSKMSGSSPFSQSVMDRPCPFRLSTTGSHVSHHDESSEIEFCASPASSKKYKWGYGSLGTRLTPGSVELGRKSEPIPSPTRMGSFDRLDTLKMPSASQLNYMGKTSTSSGLPHSSENGSDHRRSSGLEPIPDTPTSRMSGSSIFAAGAVFDRPVPFVLDSNGGHVDVADGDKGLRAATSGDQSWGSSPESPDQALTPTPIAPDSCMSPTPKWSMKENEGQAER